MDSYPFKGLPGGLVMTNKTTVPMILNVIKDIEKHRDTPFTNDEKIAMIVEALKKDTKVSQKKRHNQ